MSSLIYNNSLLHCWNNICEKNLIKIFKIPRECHEEDFIRTIAIIWHYNEDDKPNGHWFIALIFYFRNFRELTINGLNNTKIKIPKGRGNKLLSYYMMLWLLTKDKKLFLSNYDRYIKLGYYRDCLSLAMIAKNRNFTDEYISILLEPLANALINDEYKIIQNHLNTNKNKLQLSLASKWAPREGGAYSVLIPYLKKLCGINGKNSNKAWRKYIQKIKYHHTDKTIETLLSSHKYDLIDFNKVPNKAFDLYKNAFIKNPLLKDKYKKYNKLKKITDSIQSYEILNKYIHNIIFNSKLNDIDIETENCWRHYIINAINSSLSLDRMEYTYIPIIDMTSSMFYNQEINKVAPAKVAITLGIIMSILNTGIFNRKSISFCSNPTLTNIDGDTAFEQINSLQSAIANGGSINEIDVEKVYTVLLDYIFSNKITPEQVKQIKIIIFTDTDFDSVIKVKKNIFDELNDMYISYNYTMPQIIFWNLNGEVFDYDLNRNKLYDNKIIHINGFDSNIIDLFVESGEINLQKMPIYILNKYLQLVM